MKGKKVEMICIVAVLLLSFFLTERLQKPETHTFYSLNSGWYQIKDGEKIHILPPKSVIFSIIPEMRGKGKKKIPDLPIRDRALLALNLLLGAVRLENIGVVQLTYQIGLDAVDVDPPQRGTLSGFFLRQLPFPGNVGQLVDSCNNFIHFHRKPHT